MQRTYIEHYVIKLVHVIAPLNQHVITYLNWKVCDVFITVSMTDISLANPFHDESLKNWNGLWHEWIMAKKIRGRNVFPSLKQFCQAVTRTKNMPCMIIAVRMFNGYFDRIFLAFLSRNWCGNRRIFKQIEFYFKFSKFIKSFSNLRIHEHSIAMY